MKVHQSVPGVLWFVRKAILRCLTPLLWLKVSKSEMHLHYCYYYYYTKLKKSTKNQFNWTCAQRSCQYCSNLKNLRLKTVWIICLTSLLFISQTTKIHSSSRKTELTDNKITLYIYCMSQETVWNSCNVQSVATIVWIVRVTIQSGCLCTATRWQ